jgi:hypothetical protein
VIVVGLVVDCFPRRQSEADVTTTTTRTIRKLPRLTAIVLDSDPDLCPPVRRGRISNGWQKRKTDDLFA